MMTREGESMLARFWSRGAKLWGGEIGIQLLVSEGGGKGGKREWGSGRRREWCELTV